MRSFNLDTHVIRDALDEKFGVRNLAGSWVVYARIVNPNQRPTLSLSLSRSLARSLSLSLSLFFSHSLSSEIFVVTG